MFIGKTIRVFPLRLVLASLFIIFLFLYLHAIKYRFPNDDIKKRDLWLQPNNFIDSLYSKLSSANDSADQGLVMVFSGFIFNMSVRINKLEERIKVLETVINEKNIKAEAQPIPKGNLKDLYKLPGVDYLPSSRSEKKLKIAKKVEKLDSGKSPKNRKSKQKQKSSVGKFYPVFAYMKFVRKCVRSLIKLLRLLLRKDNALDNPDCTVSSFEGFSSCLVKFQWMKEKWMSDPCYAKWGVDGSECSILKYLSEVENYCPRVDGTKKSNSVATKEEKKNLTMQNQLKELYSILSEDKHFDWVLQRIRRMESKWLSAAEQLVQKSYFKNWKERKIFIFPGLLAEETGWNIAKNAFTGGPLGELVQWADIIASLYLLGHKLTIVTTPADLKKHFDTYINGITSHNCPVQHHLFDAIYTDISGLRVFRKVAGTKLHLIQCEMRVVDSFGTEPEFNFPPYANRKKKKSEWGKLNLFPKQFNTMFPHTPDNTFLGFVIESLDEPNTTVVHRDKALVYGKRDKFWSNRSDYLSVISKHITLHATVSKDEKIENIPSYVINHGLLPGEELHRVLHSSKIFVGMGFPYEGPAPLEAIADGAVFLNPVFEKGSAMYNEAEKFYMTKPTSRRLTSQHPYAENFIGPPHVRMVHMSNVDELSKIVSSILEEDQITGYIPYEFTCFGMLERLGFLVEQQEFCYARKPWPPLSAMKILILNDTGTCTDLCMRQGLVCEPHYFPDINQRSTFKLLNIHCKSFESPTQNLEETDYPSFKDGKCYIQGNSKLFSCSGRSTDTNRICPCRDFIKGQVALCKDCFHG